MPALSGSKIFGIAVLCVAVALGVYALVAGQQAPVQQQTATSEVPIGGPFELVDHTGKTVTDKTYAGKYMLIYFGFTYCPDICPTELQVIANALDKLSPSELDAVQPLFVTVDPERDTVTEMAGYVEHFHDDLIGLTGSQEQVTNMADAYRVWFKRMEDEDSTAGYTMEHTNIVYLMGPDGKYADHFTFNVKADEMAERISKRLTDH